VAEVLAPLLVQALNLVVPGLGLALAPVLPVAFPIAGRLMAGAGQGGGGAAPDLTVILDALVAFGGAVPGSVATPAGVV
jgi:hypothetical protein